MDDRSLGPAPPLGDGQALAEWLLEASPRWRQVLQHALEPFSLRENDVRILRRLATYEAPFGQQALGLALRLDASTLARCLARLEDQGLLTRQADDADRRALWVALTEQGRELAEALTQTLSAVLQPVWKWTPPDTGQEAGIFILTPGVRGRTVVIHADEAEVKEQGRSPCQLVNFLIKSRNPVLPLVPISTALRVFGARSFAPSPSSKPGRRPTSAS